MPILYMIRHGQAAFGADNYDELSPLGYRQCQAAGAHLQDLGVRFDGLYRGHLARQTRSAIALSSGYQAGEGELPRPVSDAAFDEYDADSLFSAYLPRILAEDAELAAVEADIYSDRDLFQKAFSRVMDAWLGGRPHDQAGLESWREFLERVESGLERIITEQKRTATVAVVTSGGPIAVAVRSALELTDKQTIKLNYGIYNASVTRLAMGRSGRRLMGFNEISHLELMRESKLVTFR